jgi:hypothetical protein
MVSKCLNPKCSAEFRYFGEGQLYEFTPESAKDASELYWLCDACAHHSTLGRDADGQVRLLSRKSDRGASLDSNSGSRINLGRTG